MPRFSIKKKKTNMVLKHFILPEEHFKANLFFPPLLPPLTHPITHKLALKLILGDLKNF